MVVKGKLILIKMIEFKSMAELDTDEKYNEYISALKKDIKEIAADDNRTRGFIWGIFAGMVIGMVITFLALSFK